VFIQILDGTLQPVANLTATFDSAGGRYYALRSFTSPGTYTYHVWARDAAGNWGTAQGTFTVQDSIDPSVTLPRAVPNPSNVSDVVNLSAIVTDNVGVDTVYIEIFDANSQSVANLTATFDSASGRYYATRAISTAGTYTYRVWAKDAAGNWATASGTFVVSAASPPGGAPVSPVLWVFVIIVVAAAALSFFLWSRRRRKSSPAAPPAGETDTSAPPAPPPSSPPGWAPAQTNRDEMDDMLGPPSRP